MPRKENPIPLEDREQREEVRAYLNALDSTHGEAGKGLTNTTFIKKGIPLSTLLKEAPDLTALAGMVSIPDGMNDGDVIAAMNESITDDVHNRKGRTRKVDSQGIKEHLPEAGDDVDATKGNQKSTRRKAKRPKRSK